MLLPAAIFGSAIFWSTVISAVLFVLGAVSYWIVSRPLKELPNYYQLVEDKAAPKGKA